MKARTILITGLLFCTLTGACGNSNENSAAQENTQIPVEVASTTSQTEGETWYHDWDTGMAAAQEEQKPILVHFTADWCKYCIKMKKETYAADEIKKRFSNGWVTIMIDTEEKDKTGKVYFDEAAKKAMVYLNGDQGNFEEKVLGHQELLQFFGGMGLPTLLFVDKDGTPLQKISSFIEKEEFAVILDFFREEAYKTSSFDDFKKNRG